MILLILGFVFLICSLILFYKANQIKINKQGQKQKYIQNLQKLSKELEIKIENLLDLNRKKERQLQKEYLKYEQDLEKNLNQKKNKRQQEIEAYIESQKQLADQTVNAVYESAQKQISDINNDIQNTRNIALQEKEQIQTEINKLKASLSAGVEARLREQEKKDKINFYKPSISEADLADVKMLQNLKSSFHKPVVLSKLIWTQYFQKQMTELCDRVLGKKTVCGIYKITNLLTEQCYIGQSVNISDRWKQHCKCGLGIEASATNVLYNSMQRDGVWNFSFELLEECPRELLNQKEAFWIDTYSSNIYGLNTNMGVKNAKKN